MLTAPVWRGRGEQARILVVFAIGLVLGGLASSVTLWLLSQLLSGIPLDWRVGAVVSVVLGAVARDLGLISLRLPEHRRQIPEAVFDRGILTASLQFGFELGTGVRTYLSASAPYVLAAAVFLISDSFVTAVAVGIGFGLGRALMPVLRALSEEGDSWDGLLARRLPILTPVTTGATGMAALAISII